MTHNSNTIETSNDNYFEGLGLSPIILSALRELGYEEPTPIQKEAIPLIMDGHDLMGLAQTGTGKTAAFGLPLVQHLMGIGSKPYPKTIRALILSPTRELANQIADNLRSFVKDTHLRVVTVVGGQSIAVQQKNLGKGTDILVATPGRLLDLVERKAVLLDSAKFLVLDEADQMLDLGFIHALKKISKMVAKERQTLLFSATMPKEIADLAQAFLNDPVRIQVAPPGKAADKVSQCVYYVGQRAKADLLKSHLAKRPEDLSLVFARTKHGAEKLMKGLVAEGFPASSIHGNKSQGQRDRAIREFKSGEIRILVATDVAARGIDISGVSHVYNFDLPEVPANYVHRIGRTARAGAEGQAVAYCAPEEAHMLLAIEKLMGMKIEVAGGSMSDKERIEGAKLAKELKQGQGRRGPSRGSRGGAGKGGGQAGRQDGARRGTPERIGSVSAAIARADAEENQAQGNAASAPQRDDYAKVKAAGFTGKPNSKKNRKRFGSASEQSSPPVSGNGRGKSGGNRHAPEFRAKETVSPQTASDSKKPNRSKNQNDNQHGADRASSAPARGGRGSVAGPNSRPGKKPASGNGSGRPGGAGYQGRRRSHTA